MDKYNYNTLDDRLDAKFGSNNTGNNNNSHNNGPKNSNNNSKLSNMLNNIYLTSKNYVIDAKDAFIDLLKDTRAEIVIGAIAGSILAGTWTYSLESKKDRCLRVAFSETSQIERQAKKLGVSVPHMTDFLAKTNDFYMGIFLSHDDSWISVPFLEDNTRSFAIALDHHVDPSFKVHHYELPQLAELSPKFADSLLVDLSYLRTMQSKVNNTVQVLDKTWDDYHHDSYHTEIYYTTSTDSKGNVTTQMHTRQVYDHTDNTYKFYRPFGEQSAVLLNKIKQEFPKIKQDGLFMPALETGAENEYVIEQTRKSDLKGKQLTPEDYVNLANSFLFGSRQYTDLRNLEKLRASLASHGDDWQSQKNTASSYTKRTYNHSHAESVEFLTCERAISDGKNISSLIDATLGSIESTRTRVPKLFNMIKTYIKDSYLHEDDKNIQKLKKEIMSEAIKGYEELYPNGVKLKHSNYWNVLWLGLLGAAIGGVIGTGFDFAGDRTDMYSKRRREDESCDPWGPYNK